ncbi:MAG: hypothetical protein K2H76_07810, partial [Muribaculaceae bacterium]|nr:hypothetical protein [Muribaculaceae bacterium]
MKKFLLSLATVALTASASWANETTLTFDEEGDVAGLTRISGTSNPTAQDCVKDFSFTQDGISCAFTTDVELLDSSIDKMVESTGAGFALFTNTNAAKSNDRGIYISSYVNTRITLSSPGGKISGVKLIMSGYAMSSLNVITNGTGIEAADAGNNLYAWSWTEAEGVETVTMEFLRTFMGRYVHSIEISYVPDLGGKQNSDLSFSAKSAEVIIGERESFLTLSNPHALRLTWSRRDESVA